MSKDKRYLEAFKEDHNIVGLAAAVALSAATLNPLPLLVGLVAEAAYLLFVPDSRWYDARLSKRCDAEVDRRREQVKAQVLPTLRPELQERFTRLEETRRQIDTQARDDEKWFREVLRKLDYLLEKFLLFAGKEGQFRSYLYAVRNELSSPIPRAPERYENYEGNPRRARSSSGRSPRPLPAEPPGGPPEEIVREIQAHYDQDIRGVAKLLETEQDLDTKAVLEKRKDVLERRQEYIGKIGKILTNLVYQLELLEDTFGLINDQVRARSPEQVLADIEGVVWQTDSMTRLLEEIAPYEQMDARLST